MAVLKWIGAAIPVGALVIWVWSHGVMAEENAKQVRSVQAITDSLTKLHEDQATAEQARRQAVVDLCLQDRLSAKSVECQQARTYPEWPQQ